MRPLQDRSESDCDSDSEFDDFDPEEAVGWDADVSKLDRYVKNKNATTRLVRLANEKISLLGILNKYNVEFSLRLESPSGWTHKAKCPFKDHRDSTPSFGYNSKEDRFNCLGCQRSGRAVEFLAFMQSRSFVDVATELLGTDDESDFEDVIESLEDSDNDKIDELLINFSIYVHDFIMKHRDNPKSYKYSKVITRALNLYIEQNAMRGTIYIEELEARLSILREYLDLFGEPEK